MLPEESGKVIKGRSVVGEQHSYSGHDRKADRTNFIRKRDRKRQLFLHFPGTDYARREVSVYALKIGVITASNAF